MSALTELYQEISVCRKCDIAASRTKVVPGEGAEDAQIMFIGEAPGWHEDQQGRPFVGPAGQFLDKLLASVNLKRESVYITNIIKTRPPNNRDPLPQEILSCKPWLDRQIKLIRPHIIVTLGRLSMALYFPGRTISQIHGMAYEKEGVTYFPMYHPAAALHQPGLRETLLRDMLKLPPLLEKMKPKNITAQQAEIKQLNLL
jgi:DNA polymerase